MNSIRKLCLGTYCTITPGSDPEFCERQYQVIYKPLVSSLYNLPQLPFSLYISGILIDWLERQHPEFFMILEEMANRKQIDILGGGYYNPFFPLLPPADRVGQIELLTTSIRKHFGKRPRGAWLAASAWDPSMVSSLHTCGIEYVLLDKTMFEANGEPQITGLSPVIMEDCGKTLVAFPLDNTLRNPEAYSPEDFLSKITSNNTETEKVQTVIVFPHQDSLPALFSQENNGVSWIEHFVSLIEESEKKVELTTTSRVIASRNLFHRAYISTGMAPVPACRTETGKMIRGYGQRHR
ncbi:hypothetical protein K7I13_01405 [Brucepastera parasyntrophica]|uniref:hypothetical protein n=1 Tax=Brucepastera parasyntrophica TaxID=2880008 RepID=UPI00210AB40B|nr:hypothetical protein [Brucepastera parasyntrophica]ULQ60020.1 hypothetical protein K7I13_01405 [Brucepastera parasyntrophica]